MTRRLRYASVVSAAAFAGVATIGAADILAQLGLKPQQARNALLFSLTTDTVQYDVVRHVFKTASPDARATLVKAALDWARAAVDTPEFGAAYAAYREEHKPQPAKPAGQALSEAQAESKKRIEESKKQLPSLAPEVRKVVEETIKQIEASVDAQQNDPALRAKMEKMIVEQDAQHKKDHEARLKAYEEKYPADPHKLVAMRLQRFVDVCGDVDFGAALTDDKGIKQFADPRYQAKPDEWKLCYRAGKPAVDLARTFATSWLTALRGGTHTH
jgi:hypothetical protein